MRISSIVHCLLLPLFLLVGFPEPVFSQQCSVGQALVPASLDYDFENTFPNGYTEFVVTAGTTTQVNSRTTVAQATRYNNGNDAFSVWVLFPPSSMTLTGCIYEMAGASIGLYLGIIDLSGSGGSARTIRLRAGDATVSVATDSTQLAWCQASYSAYVDNLFHRVEWYVGTAAGEIRLWIDGVLLCTDTSTGTLGLGATNFYSESGAVGAWGQVNGAIPLGESTTTFSGALSFTTSWDTVTTNFNRQAFPFSTTVRSSQPGLYSISNSLPSFSKTFFSNGTTIYSAWGRFATIPASTTAVFRVDTFQTPSSLSPAGTLGYYTLRAVRIQVNSGRQTLLAADTTTVTNGAVLVTAGQWHQFTIQFTGTTTIDAYLDTLLIGTVNPSAWSTTTATRIHVVYLLPTTVSILIDDLRMYNGSSLPDMTPAIAQSPCKSVCTTGYECESFLNCDGVCPTSQISVNAGGVSERAFDGLGKNGAWTSNGCTHTVQGTDPWWKVDMNSVQNLRRIGITNRIDVGTQDRLSGFRVLISEVDNKANARVCYTNADAVPSLYTNVPCAGTARYIWIEIIGTSKILTLCEVEIFIAPSSGLCTASPCTDTNECTVLVDNCDDSLAACSNTAGSFTCACNSGYQSSNAGVTCTDIVNCGVNDNCSPQATCTDGGGTFACTCNSGYQSSNGGVTCTDIVNCGVNDNCSPQATCADGGGTFTCTCNSGYQSSNGGVTCTDIVNCGVNDNCSPQATCVDGGGTFTCTCNSGYQSSNAGVTCTDIVNCGVDSNCSPQATCADGNGTFTCTCNVGFQGTGILCTNINECFLGLHNCAQGALCTNTVGSFTCTCNTGYTGNGTSCTDVNECMNGFNGNCDVNSVCVNTIGNWNCPCNAGWFNSHKFTCSNIDECTMSTDNCDTLATCADTPGSFTCVCNSGYSGNGTVCYDVDECALNTHTCSVHAACTNTIGNFTCACNSGWESANAGITCTDIVNCGVNSNCAARATCADGNGSFTCTCNLGFSGTGLTCTNIDECFLGLDNCDPNAWCTNTPGSFTCVCPGSYTGNGTVCTDIDECVSRTHNCDTANAVCVNRLNGWDCPCNTGWTTTNFGINCTNIDECTGASDNCDTFATCTDTPGSFTCVCNIGFMGNGTVCSEIDECFSGTDNCASNAMCINTAGSFTCLCPRGYPGNGTVCSDANECIINTHNCANAKCTNTQGSFTCVCMDGFLDAGSDGTNCEPCPRGTFCPVNTSRITRCPMNTYNPVLASTNISSCIPCPSGTFAKYAGRWVTDCQPGYMPLFTNGSRDLASLFATSIGLEGLVMVNDGKDVVLGNSDFAAFFHADLSQPLPVDVDEIICSSGPTVPFNTVWRMATAFNTSDIYVTDKVSNYVFRARFNSNTRQLDNCEAVLGNGIAGTVDGCGSASRVILGSFITENSDNPNKMYMLQTYQFSQLRDSSVREVSILSNGSVCITTLHVYAKRTGVYPVGIAYDNGILFYYFLLLGASESGWSHVVDLYEETPDFVTVYNSYNMQIFWDAKLMFSRYVITTRLYSTMVYDLRLNTITVLTSYEDSPSIPMESRPRSYAWRYNDPNIENGVASGATIVSTQNTDGTLMWVREADIKWNCVSGYWAYGSGRNRTCFECTRCLFSLYILIPCAKESDTVCATCPPYTTWNSSTGECDACPPPLNVWEYSYSENFTSCHIGCHRGAVMQQVPEDALVQAANRSGYQYNITLLRPNSTVCLLLPPPLLMEESFSIEVQSVQGTGWVMNGSFTKESSEGAIAYVWNHVADPMHTLIDGPNHPCNLDYSFCCMYPLSSRYIVGSQLLDIGEYPADQCSQSPTPSWSLEHRNTTDIQTDDVSWSTVWNHDYTVGNITVNIPFSSATGNQLSSCTWENGLVMSCRFVLGVVFTKNVAVMGSNYSIVLPTVQQREAVFHYSSSSTAVITTQQERSCIESIDSSVYNHMGLTHELVVDVLLGDTNTSTSLNTSLILKDIVVEIGPIGNLAVVIPVSVQIEAFVSDAHIFTLNIQINITQQLLDSWAHPAFDIRFPLRTSHCAETVRIKGSLAQSIYNEPQGGRRAGVHPSLNAWAVYGIDAPQGLSVLDTTEEWIASVPPISELLNGTNPSSRQNGMVTVLISKQGGQNDSSLERFVMAQVRGCGPSSSKISRSLSNETVLRRECAKYPNDCVVSVAVTEWLTVARGWFLSDASVCNDQSTSSQQTRDFVTKAVGYTSAWGTHKITKYLENLCKLATENKAAVHMAKSRQVFWPVKPNRSDCIFVLGRVTEGNATQKIY